MGVGVDKWLDGTHPDRKIYRPNLRNCFSRAAGFPSCYAFLSSPAIRPASNDLQLRGCLEWLTQAARWGSTVAIKGHCGGKDCKTIKGYLPRVVAHDCRTWEAGSGGVVGWNVVSSRFSWATYPCLCKTKQYLKS